jgi:hypothetical protein
MKLFPIRKRWLLLLVILFAAFSIFAVRLILDLREEARQMSCGNNFKQTVLALHNYHDTLRAFPPAQTRDDAGRPIHSWRGLIGPFAESRHYFYDSKEPWDGPNNRKFSLGLTMTIEGPPLPPEEAEHRKDYIPPGTYPAPNLGHYHLCPSQDHGGAFMTDMVAVVGEQTAWPESKTISLSDITDRHDTTILVVEINHSDILWSEPRDMRFDEMQFEINSQKGPSISSPHTFGPAVAFADGSVARLSENIPPEIVKAMLTIAGGEKLDKAEMGRKGWLR